MAHVGGGCWVGREITVYSGGKRVVEVPQMVIVFKVLGSGNGLGTEQT